MLFFVDNNGTVISGKPSPVYQGAADTNNIVLVAPFAANLQLAVAFTLPNGVNTQPYMMTQGGAVNGVEFAPTGTGMAIWTFSMPSEITAHNGTVYAQFYAYGTNGQITPTSRISFSVAKGVEAELPNTPEQNIYNQILTALSQLTSQLNDGAYAARAIYWWIDTFTYGMSEVTFYPVGTYGAFVRSVAENNTGNQPYGDDGALDSAHWQELVNFNKIYAAEQNATAAAGAAATSATAAAASAKQAGDSATAAEQSVQKAAASADSAEESANGAATSAQNAAASAKSAQESAAKAEQSAGAAAEVSITLFDINFDDIDSDEGVVLPPEINEKRLTNPANLVIRCVPPSDLSSSSAIIMLYPNTGRSALSVYWGNIVEDNYGLYRIAVGFLSDGHCYIVHNEYILPAMTPQADKGKALVVGDEYYALEERIAPLPVSNVAKAYVSQENTGDTIGVEVSQQTKAYAIALRDGSGNLKTNTPSFADDVAPKSYVDAETERAEGQEQAIAQQVETLSQNINNSLLQKQNITDNTLETTAKTIPAAINENKQAIDGLRNDMTAQDHFKGFANTAADVQEITGDLNDFVYCIGTGTIWTYGASGWADSGKPYPSDATPLGNTTPLMDGTGAAGTSSSAARADHIHPTDTSRASAAALQAETEARTAAVNAVQTVLTAEITRAKNAEQANATAAANAQNTANSKYTKPSSGIPATDLAQAAQESLEKADGIPSPTAADNGKVLGVQSGAYALVEQSNAQIEDITNNTTKIANSTGGFAAGDSATATYGGAIGNGASAGMGGAVGRMANTSTGGAVGQGANSTTGFAGGYNAMAIGTGAVQLGTGTNSSQNTLQFRGYQVVDANGNIPSDRLANAALKKTWDNLATYTYSGSGSLPNNILYPTMAFGDCEYREIIGADFNDIINNGHYVIRTNSTHVAAHAPINGSVSTATNGIWHLIVLRYTETHIRQIAIDARNGTNDIQIRNCSNSSWGEWQSLLYTNNSVTRLMTYTTSSLSGNRTLSGAYYNYAFIIVRYYPVNANYWVEDIIPVDYLAEYPGTSSAHRVLATQTTNGWCNYWFSSGTTFNWNAGDMYRVEVYAY